ncbi:hypothetical protein ACFCWG_29285 [Streptomyces sp. NPDC056390]|uniref:hypothetical protein n=1 Tax=Streptomyces sp. NPDC056390 TaxID=3345806 RepID=UPI0035D9D179
MGPLLGFRIVNLRVRDKVAVPDLTVDLSRHTHAVIGLENGGGKSTFLAFLIHVMLPRADQFLPRVAQRRQKKRGKEKRIEHYVPGGAPTHVILEVEAPPADARRPPQRFFLGACLTKPAASGEDDPFAEYFWALPAAEHSPSLAELPLRNDHRMLDDGEWRHHILTLRGNHPGTGIELTGIQNDWDRYLRQNLKIDVEFVKSWLLAMNEDEGAADHVFTYATSRDFLNSAIHATASPDLISGLQTALTDLGHDADNLALDRRRLELLKDLVRHTDALVDHRHHLAALETGRYHLLDHLLSARHLLERQSTDRSADYARHAKAHTEAEAAFQTALAAYSAAHARQSAGKVQLAQLRLQDTKTQLVSRQGEFSAAQLKAQAATAAALRVRQDTAHQRMQDIRATLAARSQGAEPQRRSAASAALALLQRLTDEERRLKAEHTAASDERDAAGERADAARSNFLSASTDHTQADTHIQTLQAERERIETGLRDAVRAGILSDRDDPQVLLMTAQARHAALSAEQEALYDKQDRLTGLVAALTNAHRLRTEETLQARADLAAQQKALDELRAETDDLAEQLRLSALIDYDPIRLDDHDQAIAELLALAAAQAKSRELDAAVRAAAARRAVAALESTGLLPPRPEVADICRRATELNLGARSAYSYLAQLPAAVAEDAVRNHPALCDGIVVNIPDDADHVIDLARQAQPDLQAPLVIAPPQALEAATTLPDDITVILPDAAHWSPQSARPQTEARHAEAERREQHRHDLGTRYDQTENLRRRVIDWSERIGAHRLHSAARDTEALAARLEETQQAREEAHTELSQASGQLQDTQHKLRDLQHELADTTERASLLMPLAQHLARYAELDDQTRQAEHDKNEATAAMAEAHRAQKTAEADRSQAQDHRDRITTSLGELRALVSDAGTLAAETSTDTDRIDPQDACRDLGTLREVAAARHRHWSTAAADPQLAAEQALLRTEAEALRQQFGKHPQHVQDAARSLCRTHPQHSADDHTATAESTQEQALQLSSAIGALETDLRNHRTEANTATEEHGRLHRSIQLEPDERATTVHAAQRTLERLTAARETARAARTHADQLQENTQALKLRSQAARDLTANGITLLQTSLPLLAASVGGLSAAIDLDDRAFHVLGNPPPAPAPDSVQSLLHQATAEVHTDDTTAALDNISTTLESDIGDLRHRLTQREELASRQLEDLEATLRGADNDVVSGDSLVHMLRRLPRTRLLQDADTHHHNATSRCALLQDVVDSFDSRVEDVGHTTYATVQALLRGVQAIVSDSYLPATPALGPWAGLPLLKLTGLDLKKDQRKANILSLLQTWFDPHTHSARPDFDADTTVYRLVEAVTPAFNARVLIPSDPLDPRHKPVDRLAVETSGGEGVTFALILAALLAARRAAVHGHRHTTLLLDNPFAKVTKPDFLRLARDIATSLGVRFVPFTGIRDLGALTVFSGMIQLRVSRRESANIVIPYDIEDADLQPLLHQGTLYISATERDSDHSPDPALPAWPTLSAATVRAEQALFEEGELL